MPNQFIGVPDWFSWENQGGGIVATELGGARKLVAFMIDNPAQKNAGLYQLLELDPDPSRDGAWELLAFHSGVPAVHAALLPDGKVLFFAGSGSSGVRFDSPLFGDEDEGIFTSVVWDPPGNDFAHPPTLRTADGRPFDFFCGGDAPRRWRPTRRPPTAGRPRTSRPASRSAAVRPPVPAGRRARVFSGGRMDDPLDVQPCIFDLTQNPVPTKPVPDLLAPDTRNQSASVLCRRPRPSRC